MLIQMVKIQNFKSFKNFKLELNEDINIIVGNNEEGKSTLLEAINLALCGQLNGRNIINELSPHIFNIHTVKEYISQLRSGLYPELPRILIELYLKESEETVDLYGSNNTERINSPGIFLSIEFNEEFALEYEKYIQQPDDLRTIPVEFYSVKWYSFGYNVITTRSIPINVSLIDTTIVKMQNGTDQYISKIIADTLDPKERVNMAIDYRKLKEVLGEQEGIKSINAKLSMKKGDITDKDLTVSFDISSKANWESSLQSYLNEIPFHYSGKGEQNTVKLKLAIETKADKAHLILIEEPENHLSFSNMNKLINHISEKCQGKQMIITTHSTFVLNKLGIEKVILIKNGTCMTLKDLTKGTQNYFMKLPGYDTLRMLLAKKTILVEGPSDELIVQRAYYQSKGKLPIEDGIDVVSVDSLAFKRFLEIAKELKLEVSVVTDNDGNLEKLRKKYVNYLGLDHVKICYDDNEEYTTLEPQIIRYNGLAKLNEILGKEFSSEEEMESYLINNKTNWALKVFESEKTIKIPEYIENAYEK